MVDHLIQQDSLVGHRTLQSYHSNPGLLVQTSQVVRVSIVLIWAPQGQVAVDFRQQWSWNVTLNRSLSHKTTPQTLSVITLACRQHLHTHRLYQYHQWGRLLLRPKNTISQSATNLCRHLHSPLQTVRLLRAGGRYQTSRSELNLTWSR